MDYDIIHRADKIKNGSYSYDIIYGVSATTLMINDDYVTIPPNVLIDVNVRNITPTPTIYCLGVANDTVVESDPVILVPCTTDLVFQTLKISDDGTELVNNLGTGNAKLINSNCLSFNGVDNEITLTPITRTSNDLHIEGWFNLTTKTQHVIYSEGLTSSVRSLVIAVDGAFKGMVVFDNTNVAKQYTFPLAIDECIGKWGYLVIDITNDILTVGANGQLMYTYTITPNIRIGSNYNVAVGRIIYDTLPAYYIQASIAGLKINNGQNDYRFSLSEGYGATVICSESGAQCAVLGTLTNIWNTKQNVSHENISNGCSVFVDDIINPTIYKYIRFNSNGLPILTEGDEIDGLVWYSNNPAKIGEVPNCESDTDYTNGGLNADIPPDLNAWNAKDNPQPISHNVRYFYEMVKDSNAIIIATKNHIVYNKDEAEPSGSCLAQSQLFVGEY